MGRDNCVDDIFNGLEPRSSGSGKSDVICVDGYVPKANGVSITDKLRNSCEYLKREITYSKL